jgi:hypothetical protein
MFDLSQKNNLHAKIMPLNRQANFVPIVFLKLGSLNSDEFLNPKNFG